MNTTVDFRGSNQACALTPDINDLLRAGRVLRSRIVRIMSKGTGLGQLEHGKALRQPKLAGGACFGCNKVLPGKSSSNRLSPTKNKKHCSPATTLHLVVGRGAHEPERPFDCEAFCLTQRKSCVDLAQGQYHRVRATFCVDRFLGSRGVQPAGGIMPVSRAYSIRRSCSDSPSGAGLENRFLASSRRTKTDVGEGGTAPVARRYFRCRRSS